MTDFTSEVHKGPGLVLWLPLALFGLIAGLGAYALLSSGGGTGSSRSTEVRSTMVDKPLPDFVLAPALNGRAGLGTADFQKGGPRLLNLFASWCIPCAGEAPQLEALKAKGVKIEGVAIRDKPEDITKFLTENGDPYVNIGSDPKSTLLLTLGASGVPETFIVDGKGIIRYQHLGPIAPEHVPDIMAELEKAR